MQHPLGYNIVALFIFSCTASFNISQTEENYESLQSTEFLSNKRLIWLSLLPCSSSVLA